MLNYVVCLSSNKQQSEHAYLTQSLSMTCKDASYEPPFTMDIDLDFYRSQHDKLVGREWLLNELDEKMFFSKRGVLLLAEMGYGKSAIVAHLICQGDKRFLEIGSINILLHSIFVIFIQERLLPLVTL